MSSVKISQINTLTGISNPANVLVTGVEKINNSEEFNNINLKLSDIISLGTQTILSGNYNPNDNEKGLTMAGLKNSFLASGFDNSNDTHALKGKNLYFLDKTNDTFSVIYEKTNTDEFKFSISNDTETEQLADGSEIESRVTKLSVTNNSTVLSSLNLEDLALLANYGFISEAGTTINATANGWIEDKINANLHSPSKYIQLTETTECKNNNYYIASTSSELYKQGIFDLTNITFLTNNRAINRSYILFVIFDDVTIKFPTILKWIGTESIDQPPAFETNKRYLVEVINDNFGCIAKVIYGI